MSREITLRVSIDPLETAARLAESAGMAPYFVYETDGVFTWFGGALDQLATCSFEEARAFADGRRVWGSATFERQLRVVVPAAEVRLTSESAVIRAEDPSTLRFLADLIDKAPEPANGGRVSINLDDTTGFRASVAAAVERIKSGALEKVVLSRVVPLKFEADLPATYVRGRRANSPARSFLLSHNGFGATGFSPETLLEVSPHGHFVTRLLAGTRACTGDADLDDKLAEELLTDPKEVYEHAITVRSAAHELADLGHVTVDGFMTVRPRGSVQHLESALAGVLAPGVTAWDAFAQVLPAAAVTGIPGRTAYELIRRIEARGLYSGAVFTCDTDGSLDVALVLRSIYSKNGRSWLRAGAGITAQSRPDREFEETCEKLASVAPFVVAK